MPQLPTHDRSSWRNGTVSLAQGCEPQASGVSTIAVEHRRCRLAIVGGNTGGVSLLDTRDLSKEPRSKVPPASSRLPAGGFALDRPKRSCNGPPLQGGHDGRVSAAAWLPDDDLLFVTGGDECVKVWDSTAPHECVTRVEVFAQVHTACVTQGPKALAAAALSDATVRLIDLRTGRAMNTMQGHTAAVMSLTWGKAGSHHLFSGGVDGTVRAWDVRMGARSLFLCDPYAAMENRPVLKPGPGSLSEEEKERMRNPFCRARAGGPLKLSDITRCEPYFPKMNINSFLGTDKFRGGHTGQTFGTGSPQFENPLNAARFSPPRRSEQDKLREGLCSEDAAERARHAFAPPMREYENEASIAHRGAVIGLTFVPARAGAGCSGDRLLSCGVDGKLRIWNASTGAPAYDSDATLQVDSWTKAVPLQFAAASSPDDVCFLPEGKNVSMRCLRTGDLLLGLVAHTQEVHCATVVPGRGLLFTGGNDGRLLKWRLESDVPAEDVICLD